MVSRHRKIFFGIILLFSNIAVAGESQQSFKIWSFSNTADASQESEKKDIVFTVQKDKNPNNSQSDVCTPSTQRNFSDEYSLLDFGKDIIKKYNPLLMLAGVKFFTGGIVPYVFNKCGGPHFLDYGIPCKSIGKRQGIALSVLFGSQKIAQLGMGVYTVLNCFAPLNIGEEAQEKKAFKMSFQSKKSTMPVEEYQKLEQQQNELDEYLKQTFKDDYTALQVRLGDNSQTLGTRIVVEPAKDMNATKAIALHEMGHVQNKDAAKFGVLQALTTLGITALPLKSALGLAAIAPFIFSYAVQRAEKKADEHIVKYGNEAVIKGAKESFEQLHEQTARTLLEGHDNFLIRKGAVLLDPHPTSHDRVAYFEKALSEKKAVE